MMNKYNINKRKIIIYEVILVILLILAFICFKAFGYGEKETEYSVGECNLNFSNGEVLISNPSMAFFNDGVVTIGKEGDYYLTGNHSNCAIIIDTEDTGDINLFVTDLSISSQDNAALSVNKSGEVILNISGSNTFESNYSIPYDYENRIKPDACIYSKKDLTIQGDGELILYGNYHHGLSVRADFTMDSGNLSIFAKGNGIDVKRNARIKGGVINIQADNDGISAKDNEDSGKGKVVISGGELNIHSVDDGIQAVSEIKMSGCSTRVECGGEILKCFGEISVDKGCLVKE